MAQAIGKQELAPVKPRCFGPRYFNGSAFRISVGVRHWRASRQWHPNRDKGENRRAESAEFLRRESRVLLPALELIEKSESAVDDLIDVACRS